MGSDQTRVFVAILLSGLILFGWQFFFNPKQPTINTTVAKQSISPVDNTVLAPTETLINLPEVLQTEHTFTSEIINTTLTDTLSFKTITNKNAKYDLGYLLGDKGSFEVLFKAGDKFLPVAFSKVLSKTETTLLLSDSSNQFQANILLKDDLLNFQITSVNPTVIQFKFSSSAKETPDNQIRQFVIYKNTDVDRFSVADEEESEGNIRWAGVDFGYHFLTVMFPEKILAKYHSNKKGNLYVESVNPTTVNNFEILLTKKVYSNLKQYDRNLELSVDFGFFAILAVPILHALQWIYKYIPNYGVAIILLTLLLRMVTYPLQKKSFKSMKKMQDMQPELNALKIKYKDDPKKLQAETMEAFKKGGANPMGGCLPLLLQMPFFIAFYKVLYAAVELVDAPFMLWISDLSAKDPYYVLPILMTVIMFVQQKLTPNASVDQNAQKVMMIMPLVFGFIMKDLPAGLNIYMIASMFIGIVQQLFVYRTTK